MLESSFSYFRRKFSGFKSLEGSLEPGGGIQIVPVADSLGMQVSDSREDLPHNFGSLRFGEMLCFGDVMEKFSSVTHSENG